MLQRHSAPSPCAKIKPDRMAPFTIQLGFNENYQAWLYIEDFYYLGETRSVEEFGIFSNVGRETLSWKRLAYCGYRTEENSLKLHLCVSCWHELMDVSDDEEQLREALLPPVHNRWPLPRYPIGTAVVLT